MLKRTCLIGILIACTSLAGLAWAGADPADDEFFQEAQRTGAESDYEAYLKAYPEGTHAAQAKEGLKRYEDQAKRREDQAWQGASAANTSAALGAYLAMYPQGRYAKLALFKLDKLPLPPFEMVVIPGYHYEIGRYKITLAQWVAVMGRDNSHFIGMDRPVDSVSWDDVQTFLNKLNARSGRQYRLPTEAEWKIACDGGESHEYCGSDNVNAVAWYSGNSNHQTHPVGQKQPNGYGLYDMSGNVWEWTQDCRDVGDCSQRVVRGGGWEGNPVDVRAASRIRFPPSDRLFSLQGFRIARTQP